MAITINESDRHYISEFVEELLTLYESDIECFIPLYMHDMALNVRQILKEERADEIQEE